MWSEWAADNIDTRIYPAMLPAAENMWLGGPRGRGLSEEAMYQRVLVQDVSSEAIGLPHRSIYRMQIAALASPVGISSGSGEWTYAQAVANMSVAPPQNNAVYDALYHLADVFRPGDRVNIGGPAYPNFEFIDATKPNSMHMQALSLLCRRALSEFFTGPATERLLEMLDAYIRVEFVLTQAGAKPALVDVAHGIGSIATSWKNWIVQVRFNGQGEPQRQTALHVGTGYATLPPHNWAMTNSLKSLATSFLSQPVVPPPRTSATTITTTTRPTTTTTTTTSTTTSTTTTTTTPPTTTTPTTTPVSSRTTPRPTTAVLPTTPPGTCMYAPAPSSARGLAFSIVFNLDFTHFDCPLMVANFAQLWLRPQHVIRLQSTSCKRVFWGGP